MYINYFKIYINYILLYRKYLNIKRNILIKLKTKMNNNQNYKYICHYCIEYNTTSLSDIIRHFKRKNKCSCRSIFSYEDSIYLSRKKYLFTFNTKNLTNDDYIYIITHYNNDTNIINNDFKNNIKKNLLLNIPNNINLQNDFNKIPSNKNISEELLSIIKASYNTNKEDITNEEIVPIDINKKLSKIKYENVLYNNKTQNYVCGYCNAEYSFISSLKRHLKTGTCHKRQNILDILNKNNEICNKINQKDELKQNINNTFINNVHNNNNVQNINNNNNNTQNSTYNVSIRDFVNDSYDLSHIHDSFYQKKDFFLYHNFLKMIMENKNNQNIFFSENEAIMYSDNELNKMSSDKAGYLILDKLSQSFDEFLYTQDSEAREYYKFITKYYHVVKGHYKHDTIFKEYDVDEQRFIYTANSNLFRSRDKYLSKMVTTLGKVRGSTLENMSVNIDELKDIPMLNPNIEDFASVKMRYRDLKDKD